MMKKLISLMLVLAMVSVSSAVTVSLVAPAADQPGSASNPLQPSGEIMIKIVTDGALLTLDALMTPTGPGELIGAIDKAHAVEYSWDIGFAYDPVARPGGALEIGQGNFGGSRIGEVGYILFHCTGPDNVVISIVNSMGLGGSSDMAYNTPSFGGPITIYQIPEPATIALLGLGGLALLRRRK